jgi:phosphinothricin acetyltransferase
MSDILIRRVQATDLQTLLEIYNHYVLNTHVTFDIEPRTIEQRREWFNHFGSSGRLQCFVAATQARPIGWASSHPFKDRAAYDTSVETSIYLAPGEAGRGVGRRLYSALLESLAGEGVHRAFGGIALPNEASIRLHLAIGFEHVGTYSEVGRKFGKFWNVAWYQKALK